MLLQILRRTAASGLLALFAAAALPGASLAQTVEWRGTGYLHSFSNACTSLGWGGAPMFNVRFRPAGIGENGPSSRLSFFDDFYAFNLVREQGRFDRQFRPVRAGGLGTYVFVWEAPTRVRVTSQQPANAGLRATTPHIRMVGQIANFDNTPNCTASFDVTLLLRR